MKKITLIMISILLPLSLNGVEEPRVVEQFLEKIIFIVEGEGRAVLKSKTSSVKSGDMIFIPKGTQHNVVNTGQERELKLISFYSDTDMPRGVVYKKKADQPED